MDGNPLCKPLCLLDEVASLRVLSGIFPFRLTSVCGFAARNMRQCNMRVGKLTDQQQAFQWIEAEVAVSS
jgi:hypothetical protein